ncbi:MAG: molybdopterin-guanine dinucleotide biosynthesis protein A [Granulosicoccus sp.]|jgi:molybdopterin-guanine dinucleotide biosynthesis protein A
MNSLIEQNCDAKVGAVILAGGLARRMGGVDKGLVEVAGKPMVKYALDILTPLVHSVVINANRSVEEYKQFGVPVVLDTLSGHQGPLAGLSAGINALQCDYVVMCPCDSPFLQSELIQALMEGCIDNDADIAVPHDGERLQPVFCVVQRRVEASLNAFLDAGERKIDRWFSNHTVHTLDAKAYAQSFLNVNTEEERLSAESAVMK